MDSTNGNVDKDAAWEAYCREQADGSGSPRSKRGPVDIADLFESPERPSHLPQDPPVRAMDRTPHVQFPAAVLPTGVKYNRTGDLEITFKVPRKFVTDSVRKIDEMFGRLISVDLVAMPRKQGIEKVGYDYIGEGAWKPKS